MRPLLCITVLLTACGGGLAVPVPRLVVDETPVAFEAIQHGVPARREVVLSNPGTADVRARLSVEPPFQVSNDAVPLEAGGSVTVRVSLTPASYDDQAAALVITAGDQTARLPLSATIEPDWDGDGTRAAAAGGADCDDTRADVAPGLPEVCDGVDNDCDGDIDEDATDAPTFWADDDGDGYGRSEAPRRACSAPPGHAPADGDCDDTDDRIHPGVSEIADGVDQDCDGLIDEHLLEPGSLLVTEISPEARAGSPAVPAYLEIRVRAAAPLHLPSATLTLDGVERPLADGTATDCDVLILCGVGTAGTLDGVPCDAPLPVALSDEQALAITAEGPIDAVDWRGWTFPSDAALELPGDAVDADDNDDEATWRAATAPLGVSAAGTPGEVPGRCAEIP